MRPALLDALDRAEVSKVDPLRDRVTLRSLRHTFASLMAREGAGLTQTQVLMGHSTPELTAVVYSHIEIEDLRGAVEAIRPGRETAEVARQPAESFGS